MEDFLQTHRSHEIDPELLFMLVEVVKSYGLVDQYVDEDDCKIKMYVAGRFKVLRLTETTMEMNAIVFYDMLEHKTVNIEYVGFSSGDAVEIFRKSERNEAIEAAQKAEDYWGYLEGEPFTGTLGDCFNVPVFAKSARIA